MFPPLHECHYSSTHTLYTPSPPTPTHIILSQTQVDPFFVPTTEEELEEWGQGGPTGGPNLARRLVDGVRRRKGLAVEEKVVESATKQRTRARKV